MRLETMPLVPVALAFAAGVAGAAWIRPPALIIWGLAPAVILVSAWALWRRHQGLARLTVLLFVALLGLIHARSPSLPPAHLAHLPLPSSVPLEGRLAEEPRRYASDRTRLLIDAQGIQNGTEMRPTRGRVQATIYGEPVGLTQGQRIRGEFHLSRPLGFRNPGGFDYPTFLARRGIYVVASGRSDWLELLTPEEPPWTVRIRRWTLATLKRHLPPPSAGLLAGLLLGERIELPPGTVEAFRRAGVYHVLAVSGFHVALIASTIFLGLSLLRIPRRLVASLACLLVVGYALVIGGRPSALRATVMGVLLLVGLILEREVKVLNSLALAALVILVWRPGDLWEPGFQLSFAATVGIVCLAPPILSRLEERGWPRWLAGAIAVSAGAQLAVTPLMLSHFNQLSLIGIAANLLVVPLAALAITLGLTALLITATSEALGHVLFQSVWLVLLALRSAVYSASAIPGAMVHLPAPHWSVVGAFYGLLWILAWPSIESLSAPRSSRPNGFEVEPEQRPYRFRWVVAGLLALWVVAASLWPWIKPNEGRLRVTFLDVGQGDAVFVELPGGERLLIDGGPGGSRRLDVGELVIAPFLWNRAVRHLDVVAVTHSDPDHAGGLPAVLRRFTVGESWDNGYWDRRTFGLRELVENSGVRRRSLHRGERIWLGPVMITVLNPPARYLQGSLRHPTSDDNNNSLVLRLDWGEASFLFAGDLEREGERALLDAHQPLRHLVLKVAHHGSRFSTTRAFLAAARPTFGVITVGARNPFGHPTRETLERLTASGVRVYRTDRDGAIIFDTDGHELLVTRWATRQTERWQLDPHTEPPPLGTQHEPSCCVLLSAR
ncbi:MAG: DNA internalization-related competence protein ComEC/Rec2 [Candidatus Methylomirabilia bacterium]